MTHIISSFSEIRKTNLGITDWIYGKDLKSAKEKIKSSLLNLNKLYSFKTNALTQCFFDAKSDEILSVFLAVK
jgi:hypothetical protein